MHMMHGFHPQIRERQLFSLRQFLENRRIEIACRIHDNPAWSHDVTWVQDGGRETMQTRLIQQIGLDGGFLDAVFPKGTAGLFFGRGHTDAGAMHPDGAATDEMLHLTT